MALRDIFLPKIKKLVLHKFVRGKTLETSLRKCLRQSSVAMKMRSGLSIIHDDLKREVYDWKATQRESKNAVSTASIIVKNSAIDFLCLKMALITIFLLDYSFLTHCRLRCHVATHTGQNMNCHQLSVRNEFVNQPMSKFSWNGTY